MTRKKCRQKITSFLVIMAMVITCISPLGASVAEPSYAQDEETTVKTGKAVYTDMGLISGYDSTNSYDFIWMGEYKKQGETAKVPLKWRVLDDKTNTGGDGYFLLACGTVDNIYFEKTGDPIGSSTSNVFGDLITGNTPIDSVTSIYTEYGYSTLYKQSDARMWCQDFSGATTGSYKWGSIPSAFTALEQAAILPTSKSDGSYTATYKNNIGISHSEIFMGYNNILNNDKVFLPSAEELYNEGYGVKENAASYPIWSWLRSYPLPYGDNQLKAGKIQYDEIFVLNAFTDVFTGSLSGTAMQECATSYAATPALNMAPDKALFTTDADNSGQVNFGLAKDYTGSEWKLTLKDNNSFASGAAVSGNKTTVKAGDSLTVNHKTLSSFDAGYTNVTAALVDEAGNVCAYGSVNNNTSATSSTFTIPENCEYGTYTLMISGEDWNAAHYTNYATGTPFTTTIQVTSPVELSGTIDITGTPEVGNTLNASVAGSNVDDDTLIYNWYREGSTDSLGTGKTYELTADDYNKNIICKVTSSKYSGEISKTVGLVAQGTPDIGTVTANELSDTLDVSQVALSRTDTSIPGELELTDNVLQYGTNTYNWKFTPENQAYKAITGTVSITVKDTIAPTAKYQVNDSQWREFVNFVTFGIFCKDTAVLKVEAADSGSGVGTVEYYVSASKVADPSAINEWDTYSNSVALNQKSANYIYVRVADKFGNTVVYEEGVVVYTESAAKTTEVEYSYKEGKDKEILVDFNGNTVKSIITQAQNPLTRSSGSTLTKGSDYAVENDRIILKKDYLDTLNPSDTAYSFQVKYNPAGIDTDKVNMATTFAVKVSKADLVPASGDVKASGTYGTKLSELTVSGPDVTSNGSPVPGKWVLTGDTAPEVGDTGNYTAKFVPDADADNYNELTKEVVLDIAKANATYTAPTAKTGLLYQKEVSQELISAGSTNHGTMKYAIGESATAAPENGWSTELPKGKNADTYYVWYKVFGDKNHKDSEADCIEVSIAKADAADVTLAEKEHVYTIATTGNEADLTANIPADRGDTTYAVKERASNLETYITNVQVDNSGKLTYDTAKATAPVDGLYITVTVTSENYNDFTVKLPIKLSDKEAVDIILPTAQNGTYNNGPHTGYIGEPAVNGNNNVAFDITYKGIGSTQYPATAEKPVNAGDYKVTFTVKDDRVQGSASLTFSIYKGTPELTNVEAETLENTTDLNEIKVTYQTENWSEGKLTIDNNQKLVYGNNSLDYTFTPNDTQNLNNASGKVNVLVKDTISPTAVISAANKEWKEFLNRITFGLLFNNKQQVTITYADNQGGSGLKEMLYFVSDKGLTADELTTVTWKSYNGAFSIDPDGEYVIYAKADDNYGNSVIVNSDGIKLDATKPLLSGISDGEVYYGNLTIQTSEEHQDVKDVEVDGVPVELEDGKYTIAADNGMHTIVVTDNAGNETTYKITVFKIYDVTFVVDGVEYLKVQVNHGADAQLPEIPHKAGYDKTAPTWDHDGKSITEDTEINALYIKNPPEPEAEESADTGEDSGFILWGMMALMSMGLAAAIISTRKKHN